MCSIPVEASKAFAKVRSSAARTSAGYKLLQPGDRVLAALSGGLDSLVMLETLLELQKRVPFDFELQTVTYDPGFPELNSSAVAEYCALHGLKHTIIHADIAGKLESSDGERFRRPCVRCSRLRRGALYKLARQIGANKLALGHHADDLLESFFISLVRGQGLTTMGPNVLADKAYDAGGSLRVIRPLAMIPEDVVKRAADCFDFPKAGECPYKEELNASGDRAWAKREIGRWNERIHDLRSLMLKSLSKVELDWLLDTRYTNID